MIIATHQETTRKILETADSSSEENDSDIEVVEPHIGWSYLGSHNFTPSAWGNLSGSSFNPILNVRLLESPSTIM